MRTSPRSPLLAPIPLLLLPVARLHAQDPTPQDPPAAEKDGKPGEEKVKEIVVIATRTQEPSFEVPRSVTVITEQDIQDRAPRTPAEALRYQPGIWVQKTGHYGGAPIIRGFMGNQVVYMFDGIRRNTAGLFRGPNSFLQTIDALDVDRIEVIRGPGSVLYGSDAIGGVLNVVSNENLSFSDSTIFGGRLHGRFASADRETSARVEGYVTTPGAYGFIGTTRRRLQDLASGREGGVQAPSGWKERNWDAEAGFRLGEDKRVDFFVQDFSRPVGYRFDKPNRVQEADRQLYGAKFRAKDLGWAEKLQLTTYYQAQSSFTDEVFWDSDSDDRTIGLDLQLESQPTDAVRLVYGLNAYRDDIDKSNPQKGTADPQVDWTDMAAFGLSEIYLGDELRLDIGLRADRFNLDSTAPAFNKLDSNIQSAINNGSFALSDLELDQTDVALTGGVGLSWFLSDKLMVYSHVGRAFRAPNKSDMLSFGAFTYGFSVPTSNLKPESSWTYELGMKGQSDDYAWSAATYLTVVSDGIVSQPGTFNGSNYVDINGNGSQDPGEQVYVKSNSSDDIIAKGLELAGVRYLPVSWTRGLVGAGALALHGNLTWMRGKDKGSGEPLDRAIPTNAVLGIRWEDSRNPNERRGWIGFEAWMVDSFDRIPTSRYGDGAFHQDPGNSGSPYLAPGPRVPGFTIFTLRGGLRLNRNASLTLGIENLSDRLYRVKDSRIDGPGINFLAALDIRF